ncbi:MAG: type II toxin-antitoxin system VapC family toxin [Micrococcales bacterium]|nr:type II toxin-antitoxin system VapC family toxin [Micrococcales bacterium]
MKLVLDTMVASELRRARTGRASPAFAAWAEAAPLAKAFISVITLHEMEVGCLLTERRDPTQGLVYRDWLEMLVEAFEGRVVPVSREVASAAAAFHVPDPAPFADALIAATAVVLGASVATRNVGDFARFEVPLVNPWDGPEAWTGG